MSPQGVLTSLVLRFMALLPTAFNVGASCGGRQLANRRATIALHHRGHNYARGKPLKERSRESISQVFAAARPRQDGMTAFPCEVIAAPAQSRVDKGAETRP